MLAPIIIKQIVKLAKGTARFDAMADSMIEKFELGCPPAGELERIIAQKQQIISALSQVSSVINTITKIGTTLDGILTGLNIAVNIIKFLPIPLPPFAPALLATGPSVAVDILGDLVKAGKGAVKIIPGALKQIADGIAALIDKLNTIDGLLNPCLLEAGLDGSINNDDLSNVLASTGLDSNASVNQATEAELLAKLQPNSNDPLFYKGWKLVIQNEPENTFSFPSRRIEGEKNNEKIYNLSDKGYSYSSSVTVLIDEIKFRIDLLPITDPALMALLDSNQSGSAGGVNGQETGTCSIGDYTTRAACEGAGGIFTADNSGVSGQDTTTFGSFNASSQGPNRLMGPGVLTPSFGDVSAKIMVETPPAVLKITATTGNVDISTTVLGVDIVIARSETMIQLDVRPDAGGPLISQQLLAGPGETKTSTVTLSNRGKYSYNFFVIEDKFPKKKSQQIGNLEMT